MVKFQRLIRPETLYPWTCRYIDFLTNLKALNCKLTPNFRRSLDPPDETPKAADQLQHPPWRNVLLQIYSLERPDGSRCDLNCSITVAIELFDLSNAVWRDLHYGYGIDAPSSVKTRVIPDLRPTNPIVILLTSQCTGLYTLYGRPSYSNGRYTPGHLPRAGLATYCS